MLCDWRGLPQCIDDGRALDGDGGLLVSGKMGHWGFVNATSGIDIDSIDHLVGVSWAITRMLDLVLACRSHQ